MATPDAGIYARESAHIDRCIQFGEAGDRIISLSFPTEPDSDDADHQLLARIEAYLGGTEDEFDDVAVGLTVPTTQRSVLEQLRTIPYGESVTVAEIAGMTPGLSSDEEEDLQTVRDALGANPVPLLLPDHRVRDGPSGAPSTITRALKAIEDI
jgi:methylated-DNA-[protein]-cysteine S-methyltransferase